MSQNTQRDLLNTTKHANKVPNSPKHAKSIPNSIKRDKSVQCGLNVNTFKTFRKKPNYVKCT